MYAAIVFLPILGSIIAGLFGRVIGARASELVTTGLLFASAALSVVAFNDVALEGHKYIIQILPWIHSGDFAIDWTVRIDTITAVMLVVVTGVSSLVHLYSIGYMNEDPHRARFFSYLSLFTFAMLVLVTANNFLQLFFGWEGVGLASYLLIGFWYTRPSANAAAIKAFVVNRVGDFGFALGIFGIYFVFKTLDFDAVFQAAPALVGKQFTFAGQSVDILTTLCLLLFVGAMGKSAQLGLHTWLPDAMEGPTPVSALIHAATMVTAGVFLVCRCSPLFQLAPHAAEFVTFIGATTAFFAASVGLFQNDIKRVIAYSTCSQLGYMFAAAGVFLVCRCSPLFQLSPAALEFVTVIGATTAFFAASVGLFQNDIKRVIAYSTCSQLGYMFAAAGVAAYNAAMFHLFTHAFFKALLFLSAGAVIHSMHHEQDMRKMGGLWKAIPFTWAMMLIGNLALTGVGIPLMGIGLAGFYSKDAIINSAFAAHTGVGSYAFTLLLVAAGMTSFYSWRQFLLTFHGRYRGQDHLHLAHSGDHAHEEPAADDHGHDEHHAPALSEVHESPLVMLVPLGVLALGALFAGAAFAHYFIGEGAHEFWRMSLVVHGGEKGELPLWVEFGPLTVTILGFLIAYYYYILHPKLAAAIQAK
ncbi:MAG: NADH-quinone oxidoreductase subunit L, partial [Rhizomicrobium sp.]